MLKNDFPFIRMVILIQQLDKKRVKIGGRNLRSEFLNFFGSGSKSELKYHLFRVLIDGKRLCLQEKGLEIVKNCDFWVQKKIFLKSMKILKQTKKILTKLDLRRS